MERRGCSRKIHCISKTYISKRYEWKASIWDGDQVCYNQLLDGSNDHVNLGGSGDLNFGASTDFSVALWVKTSGWSSDAAIVSNKNWASGSNTGWILFGKRIITRRTANHFADVPSHEPESNHERNTRIKR